MTKINVLDKGYVILVDSMGTDLSVVKSARVSYDAVWRTGEDEGKDKKLINYLWRNGHTSPFESVSFTFEVKLPIFVARQWQRHRTWKYNEISGRYTELPEEYYLPDASVVGIQSATSKQARDIVKLLPSEKINKEFEIACLDSTIKHCFETYNQLLKAKWPKELARIVLPLNTYTTMFATVDLNNLFKFLTLRKHHHAQYEINMYANAIETLIKDIVPYSFEAWENTNEKHKS